MRHTMKELLKGQYMSSYTEWLQTRIPMAGGEDPPVVDPPATEVNWEERYNGLQPEYTRATQALAERERENESLRQYEELVTNLQSEDPEVKRNALTQLGFEVEAAEEEEEGAGNELVNKLMQRIDKLEGNLTQKDQADQLAAIQEAETSYMDSAMDAITEEIGRDLTEHEVKLMAAYAITNRDAEGFPDMMGAYELLNEYDKAGMQRWSKTKQTSFPRPGGESEKQPNLDNDSERQTWMMEQLAARTAE